MTNNNSKTGLYLGIFAAVTAVTVGAILIFRGKKTSTPTRGGANTPIKTGGNLPPSSTPPIKTQQGGTDPVKSIVGGILDALGLGGGKGSGKGGGGISFGGGSGGGTKPTQSGGSSQSSTAWNSPSNYDAVLGAYIDPKSGEAYDKQGNYVGFINDSGEFLSYDKEIGGHIGSDGSLYDYEGYNIGYIDDSGDVHFTQTLSNGNVVDTETGDMWDASGNYLGFEDDNGNFNYYDPNSDTFYNDDGDVFDSSGNQWVQDEFGGWHDTSDYSDTFWDEYYGASGVKSDTNLSNMFVSSNGKIVGKKISKKNQK
jgi:hypothetical protein